MNAVWYFTSWLLCVNCVNVCVIIQFLIKTTHNINLNTTCAVKIKCIYLQSICSFSVDKNIFIGCFILDPLCVKG